MTGSSISEKSNVNREMLLNGSAGRPPLDLASDMVNLPGDLDSDAIGDHGCGKLAHIYSAIYCTVFCLREL